MGLQDKLTKGESNLTGYNGVTPPIENKSISKLHYDYSINGMPNIEPPYVGFPKPSQLDLNGKTPKSANKDGQVISINNSFKNGTYKNSAPDAGVGRI